MATAKQIQYRIGQAKKKLAKVNKDLTATKTKVKTLVAHLKKAKAAVKARPKKKAPARKKVAKKKAPARRKAPAKRKVAKRKVAKRKVARKKTARKRRR